MKRILLVDDSDVVRQALGFGLVAAGYDVITAGNYEEMMHLLSTGFDLILMDINMPELYGDDVASVLRNERGIRVPIYMLSNVPVQELAQRAAEANVDGYISKRDGFNAVLARVKQIIPP